MRVFGEGVCYWFKNEDEKDRRQFENVSSDPTSATLKHFFRILMRVILQYVSGRYLETSKRWLWLQKV